MFDPRLTVEYDRRGDTLYIWKRKPASLRSRHGEELGLIWRHDRETGEIVGVTVMGYSHHWVARLDELAHVIAEKLAMPETEAHDMLDGVLAA